jgi:curli biogenesis system outer membrane secretion channel CsgG
MRGLVLVPLALVAVAPAVVSAQEGPSGGPKVRIAVMETEWDPGVVQSAWMSGGNGPDVFVKERQTFARGLTEMMVSELLKTGRFIVVERKAIDDVFAEQKLQQSGAVNQETAAQVGRLVAAQFLIRPEITEFSYGQAAGTKGGAVKVPVKVPLAGRVRVGGGKAKITAKLVLDSRVVEVETGQITTSVKSEAEADQSMTNFDLGTAVFDYNQSDFQKTPLGWATREAVSDAVKQLVDQLGDTPWQGRVVTQRGSQIYVNAGQDSGLKPGDLLEVFRGGEKLVDPETGLSLGQTETKLGQMRVKDVQEKFLIAEPVGSFTAQRGDVVRFVKG